MKAKNQIHTCLINNHTIYEGLMKELAELENKRGKVHDSHRKELETKIGKKKDFIKFVKKQELDIREMFNYLDYS